jgi:uncharacterized iron-regulated protein
MMKVVPRPSAWCQFHGTRARDVQWCALLTGGPFHRGPLRVSWGPMMRLSHLPLLLLPAAACVHAPSPTSLPPAAQRTQGEAPAVVPAGQGHIYDVQRGRWLGVEALVEELSGAHFVLLGERHDNPHHHRHQAALVRALAGRGRRPALALEMLEEEQQPQVDASLAAAPGDADALARAVDWQRSGWAAFELYRPILAAALEAGLPVVAANLSRARARQLVKEGAGALAPAERARLGLDAPLPADLGAEMSQELRESHCHQLPESLLPGMVLAQRARDARMAHRLVETDAGEGAILITGAGHARVDRGVPHHLSRLAPGKKVLSVGFQELPEGAAAEPPPGSEPQPFDYLWFTPVVEREDPCAPLRSPAPPRGG